MINSAEFETIDLNTDELGVCSLTLNRPEVHNAFDERMIAEVTAALESAADEDAVRVLVIRGSGKSFSAGADINWMRRMADYDESQNYEDAQRMSTMMDSLYRFPKPTLASVHGSVFGGGVGLVACCDMAIACDKTIFSLSEIKLGLIPSVISPYVVEAIGIRNARRYFLSGERFTASTAVQLGLINECCSIVDLNHKTDSLVAELLQGAPNAQTIAKSLLQNVLKNQIDQDIKNQTARIISQVRASEEGREGTSAFLEKRTPNWRKEA